MALSGAAASKDRDEPSYAMEGALTPERTYVGLHDKRASRSRFAGEATRTLTPPRKTFDPTDPLRKVERRPVTPLLSPEKREEASRAMPLLSPSKSPIALTTKVVTAGGGSEGRSIQANVGVEFIGVSWS